MLLPLLNKLEIRSLLRIKCNLLFRTKDIIEHGVVNRDKSYCIDANYFKGGNLKSYFEKHRRQLVFTGGAFRGRYNKDGSTSQRLEIRKDIVENIR